MKLNLTRKQLDVLRYFRDYRQEHGLAPTLEEAAEHLGVTKITVHEHIRNLEKKGAVRRDPMKARAVTILYDPDRGFTQNAEDFHDPAEMPSAGLPSSGVLNHDDQEPSEVGLPMCGRIAAGEPIAAIEDAERLPLSELIPHGDDHYLLEVRGTSMIEDHIDDGDIVVIRRQTQAKNGEIVVAIVEDEEATLKRFYHEGDRIRLQPSNENLDPIYPERCEIRGVLRGVIRRWS
ncbi:MAG: transcriptional repressor LexA [Planctomycetota bacterium]